MRVSLNQTLRTDVALNVDLGTHKHEALFSQESHEQTGWTHDVLPSQKRNGLRR